MFAAYPPHPHPLSPAPLSPNSAAGRALVGAACAVPHIHTCALPSLPPPPNPAAGCARSGAGCAGARVSGRPCTRAAASGGGQGGAGADLQGGRGQDEGSPRVFGSRRAHPDPKARPCLIPSHTIPSAYTKFGGRGSFVGAVRGTQK
eukprot:366366-Chlamydomonas_euryale.AAC.4